MKKLWIKRLGLLSALVSNVAVADLVYVHYEGTDQISSSGRVFSGTLVIDTQYLPDFVEGSSSFKYEDPNADHRMVSGELDTVGRYNADKVDISANVPFGSGFRDYFRITNGYRVVNDVPNNTNEEEVQNIAPGIHSVLISVYSSEDFISDANPRQNFTLTNANGPIGIGQIREQSEYANFPQYVRHFQSNGGSGNFDLTSVTVETIADDGGSSQVCLP